MASGGPGVRLAKKPKRKGWDMAAQTHATRRTEKYRGVEYSVVRQTEGAWAWNIHPKDDQRGAITSGVATGLNKNPAVEAAHRAIDKMLDAKKG
jgi:hypothetical protein